MNIKNLQVFAGLGNYFNVKTSGSFRYCSLLLSSTEFGILTVTLYAFILLAGYKEPLGASEVKARNQVILCLVVCLILVSLKQRA